MLLAGSGSSVHSKSSITAPAVPAPFNRDFMYYEMMKFLAVLVLLLFFAEPSSADVYKWTDENGLIHYSSKKAKKYLRRQGIPFTEYDVEKGSRAKSLYKELGATGVPVILVGKKRMNGFSEAGFERIYK